MSAYINYIYVITKSSMTVHVRDANTYGSTQLFPYTPIELQQDVDYNTSIYLSVTTNVSTEEKIGLNYSRLITDYSEFTSYSSWKEVEDHLTDKILIGYKEDVPGYKNLGTIPDKQVVAWDCMNVTNTFNVNYADRYSGLEGIFAARYHLKDLVVYFQDDAAKYNDDGLPKLHNCIPIVNGITCRPYIAATEDKLYAIHGATYCYQQGIHRTPEVQLLDFSSIGNISKHSIYTPSSSLTDRTDDYLVTYNSKSGDISFDVGWKFTNLKYSLREYTPILVLGGMLILPDQLDILNEHTFMVHPNRFPLNRFFLYRTYLNNNYHSDAAVAYKSNHLDEYFTEQFSTTYSTESYVVLVDVPSLYIRRIRVDVWKNNIIMELYAQEGILVHDATNTVRVYHSTTLDDRKELAVQNMEVLYVSDNPTKDDQYLWVPADCDRQPTEIKNVQISTCTMLHVIGK